MNAFVDTNVSIAYSFAIDPFNRNANVFLDRYTTIFWSKLVNTEYEMVFRKKRNILTKFYKKLIRDLKLGIIINDVTFEKLEIYVTHNTYSKEERDKIKSSLGPFWDRYIKETFPSIETVITAINKCLIDLRIEVFNNKENWESKVKLSKPRTSSYDDLKRELECFGVHDPDYDIVLDAHDWNEKTDFDLDFVTFDDKCYKGASEIEGFNFHDVKSRFDFTFG